MKLVLRGFSRPLALLVAVLTVTAISAPVAVAQPAEPEFALAVSVDEDPKIVGKPFPISISLSNLTGWEKTGVRVDDVRLAGSYLSISDRGGLGWGGVTLAPYETREFTFTAKAGDYYYGDPVVRFRIPSSGEPVHADLTIPMLTTTGSATGTVYGDQDGDGVFDAGEELPGAFVSLYGGPYRFGAFTDAQGRFTFTGVHAQRYSLNASGEHPDGWIYPDEPVTVDVDGGPAPEATVRAVRAPYAALRVEGALDRHDYLPGEAVQASFTLTNTGTEPITGISGSCDRYGDHPAHLDGWENWTDLVYPARFTLAAGESRTFTGTGTVPTAAPTYGGFHVGCDFSPEPELGNGPQAELNGRVPGPPGDVDLSLAHDVNGNTVDDPGEELANLPVTLVDAVDGQSVATGTTDSAGHVRFAAVRAGSYLVEVGPDWLPDNGYEIRHSIVAGTCAQCGRATSLSFVPAP